MSVIKLLDDVVSSAESMTFVVEPARSDFKWHLLPLFLVYLLISVCVCVHSYNIFIIFFQSMWSVSRKCLNAMR